MKSVEYKSPCRACDHKHQGYTCNWQVNKVGTIKLKPTYSTLWGLLPGHTHSEEDVSKIEYDASNLYKEETFEYRQEVDCGCKCYIPSENLEFVEWKYNESRNSI